MNNIFFIQATKREKIIVTLIGIATFVAFGTVTALWENPLFLRMTPVVSLDYIILSIESLLLGLLFGIKGSSCTPKKATLGGLLSFLGYGCSICNKILLLLLGSSFLLTYFEPIRHPIGGIGITLLIMALIQKHKIQPPPYIIKK